VFITKEIRGLVSQIDLPFELCSPHIVEEDYMTGSKWPSPEMKIGATNFRKKPGGQTSEAQRHHFKAGEQKTKAGMSQKTKG
jgi:hypothetical protein